MEQTNSPQRTAIGVVLYNNDDETLRALRRSLDLSVGLGKDCIVYVFNNGDLENEALLKSHNIFRSSENLGFGRAHNRLMKAAFEADFSNYVCVNPDGYLHRHCLHHMIKMSQKFSSQALVESSQLPLEHPKPYSPYVFDTPWASGACLLITKEIFEATGGYDENIFLYCEDVDLSWSALSAGFKVKHCPEAWFYHDVSDRKTSPLIEREMYLAGRYLGRKWGSPGFVEHLERIMHERNMFLDLGELPDLSNISPKPFNPAITEFRRMFHFSMARWG